MMLAPLILTPLTLAIAVLAPPLLAIPFPTIDPVAISIGPLSVKWYGLAYVAGLLGGWWYARRLAGDDALWHGRARPHPESLDDLLLWTALGIVLGGRMGYVLFYNFEQFAADPMEILRVWNGGMAFHGGLAGALIAFWLFAKRQGVPLLSVFDLVAPVAPIGLFFGRIANFINAELWGRPAPNFPYAVIFPDAGPVPRHPSQLYEAASEGLLLFLALTLAVRMGGYRRPGLAAGMFGAGYAVFRIICEFFREPDPQLGFLFGTSVDALSGGITMGMVLSLPLLAAGLALMLVALKRKPAAD
jgi:phosphatidylglycerol---prolipoprotein diacylglyceryl transferase